MTAAGCVASDLINTAVGARCERMISCFEAKSAGYSGTRYEIKEGITRIGLDPNPQLLTISFT